MTTLYSCKSEINASGTLLYRITKFDSDMNPESSYHTSEVACECPAGARATCRHREMLPKFLARGAVNSHWLYDYDRGGWVQSDLGEALEQSEAELELEHSRDTDVELEPSPNLTATEVDERIANYAGPMPGDRIIMMGLDNLLAVHNAIADAVGESRLEPQTPLQKATTDLAESIKPVRTTFFRRGF